MKASSRRDKWTVRDGFLGEQRTPELRPQRVRQGDLHAWRSGGVERQDTEEMEVRSMLPVDLRR